MEKGASGPKQRFSEIEGRLKSGAYNAKTRKSNRNYLDKYLKTHAATGSNLTETRKATAAILINKLNAYSSPGKTKKAPRAPTPPAPSPTPSPTPPPPSRSPTPSPKSTDLYEQLDVRGDGNCFYRSLYRAAAEHEDRSILERMFEILGADKTKMRTEESGQAAIRAAIANYYKTKFLTRKGPYEMLLANYGTIQYKLWMREATKRQAAIYKNIKKYDATKDGKKQFYNDLSAVIGTNMEYASDIDYMIISDILDAGGLKIVSSKKSPSGPLFDGKPALYIKRLSYDHYNYWRRRRVAVAPKPAVAPSPHSASSNNSSTDNNEDRRQELLAKLEKRMDKHTRCVEKCKSLSKKVEETRAELRKLGK